MGYPIVAEGKARLRAIVSAAHKREQLLKAADTLAEIGKSPFKCCCHLPERIRCSKQYLAYPPYASTLLCLGSDHRPSSRGGP